MQKKVEKIQISLEKAICILTNGKEQTKLMLSEYPKKEDQILLLEMQGALKLGIEALQKQIAFKPELYGDGCDKYGNDIIDCWRCPRCQMGYEIECDGYKYCPNCGQKIDRSEIEQC